MDQAQTIAHNLNEKPSGDIQLNRSVSFRSMTLSPDVLKGLSESGFQSPTNTQAQAIPLARAGFDLLIKDKSGTGKTLIFAITILDKVGKQGANQGGPQALVIVPTRELAVQITDVLNTLGRHIPNFRAACVVGGTDLQLNRRALAGVGCVVGTMGRLLHLIDLNVLNKKAFSLFVIDEADKMYASQGFRKDLQRFKRLLPPTTQIIATSATFPDQLDRELASIMHRPLFLSPIRQDNILVSIRNFVYECKEHPNSVQDIELKIAALNHIFENVPFNQCLVFCGSRMRADTYCRLLKRQDWPCEAIFGGQAQSEREDKFLKFRQGKTRILISTDLMARGVDSANMNLVINVELPDTLEVFLHRIGRAGRFGSPGMAISFISNNAERLKLQELVKGLGGGITFYKFPSDSEKVKNCDFWSHTFEADCQDLSIYDLNEQAGNNVDKAEASQPSGSAVNNDEKPCTSKQALLMMNRSLNETKCTGTEDGAKFIEEHPGSSIRSSSAVDEAKDNATYSVNSANGKILVPPLTKVSPCTPPATPQSAQKHSFSLPISNTTDDASSIAVDSRTNEGASSSANDSTQGTNEPGNNNDKEKEDRYKSLFLQLFDDPKTLAFCIRDTEDSGAAQTAFGKVPFAESVEFSSTEPERPQSPIPLTEVEETVAESYSSSSLFSPTPLGPISLESTVCSESTGDMGNNVDVESNANGEAVFTEPSEEEDPNNSVDDNGALIASDDDDNGTEEDNVAEEQSGASTGEGGQYDGGEEGQYDGGEEGQYDAEEEEEYSEEEYFPIEELYLDGTEYSDEDYMEYSGDVEQFLDDDYASGHSDDELRLLFDRIESGEIDTEDEEGDEDGDVEAEPHLPSGYGTVSINVTAATAEGQVHPGDFANQGACGLSIPAAGGHASQTLNSNIANESGPEARNNNPSLLDSPPNAGDDEAYEDNAPGGGADDPGNNEQSINGNFADPNTIYSAAVAMGAPETYAHLLADYFRQLQTVQDLTATVMKAAFDILQGENQEE